ncbi:MAG: 3'-5' exonuclease, partial [Vitreimonas sp.]
MAEMIPDRLPSGASAGEKKVFAILQQLPDDVVVYYEPVVGERYPDFIAIIPSVGLLVIEVKGWYPNHISGASNTDVTVTSRGQAEVQKHPVRQARDYMYGLMDLARRHSETRTLLHLSGDREGRFIFPFGHLAILSNCSRSQLDERNLSQIFPSPKVVARDELESLSGLSDVEVLRRFKSSFDPWWSFDRLSGRQVDVLRSIIHPEIAIAPKGASTPLEQPDLKILDVRQERNARSLGDGHRIVYGVAGSGKTVILIARARLLAEASTKQVLILCYNRALADYFKHVFSVTSNVTCLHFHAWGGKHNSVTYRDDEDEDAYGERLLQRLANGEGDAGRFDAVFIDEAQDFARSWFQCAKLALKEPDDGDLLIVGDGGQSLYKRRAFTWRDAGINAIGRTINTRFDLDKNYRNTREILEVAASFVSPIIENADAENTLQAPRPDPALAIRSGSKPRLMLAVSERQELEQLAAEVRSLLNIGFGPSEIAVLYRANVKGWVKGLAAALRCEAPVFWPHDRSEEFTASDGITLRTMHSAKGLQ